MNLEELENPLISIENTLAFSSKDMSIDKRDAWIYGIVCGWDDNTYPEFMTRFK